jgi:hypothetical protein
VKVDRWHNEGGSNRWILKEENRKWTICERATVIEELADIL